VGPGDRVALAAPAGRELAATLHACIRIGAVFVPLPPRAPEAVLSKLVEDSRPKVTLELGWLDRASPRYVRVPARTPGADDDVCVLYTSGTTGPPKGVRLTFANHVTSATGCAEALGGLRAEDRWLLTLSPHHVGGLAILLRSVLGGQTVAVVPRFDEDTVLAVVEAGVTVASLVPTMVVRLLERGGLSALRRPRAILLGGAPAPVSTVREWRELGIAVLPTYGLTETCSQVATAAIGEVADTGLVPHSQVTVRTRRQGGGTAPCGAGEVGEIVVSGAVLSPGYVTGANAGFSAPHHSFDTGDLGSIDGRGRLTVIGRGDDTIITGGENVHPAEVEATLMEHPAVRDAAVWGRPDARLGSVLEALVVSAGAGPEELRAWCAGRLEPAKVPRRFVNVVELPRNAGGKLLRDRLPLATQGSR